VTEVGGAEDLVCPEGHDPPTYPASGARRPPHRPAPESADGSGQLRRYLLLEQPPALPGQRRWEAAVQWVEPEDRVRAAILALGDQLLRRVVLGLAPVYQFVGVGRGRESVRSLRWA
jgi:hypothetical protein